MKNYFTYDRLHDPPLPSALNLCIIISCDIFNQVLLVPSCYQQWILKIFIITLLSTQVKALQIAGAENSHCLFSFAYYVATKECRTEKHLLENNMKGDGVKNSILWQFWIVGLSWSYLLRNFCSLSLKFSISSCKKYSAKNSKENSRSMGCLLFRASVLPSSEASM